MTIPGTEGDGQAPELTVIVPTFNEAPNVAELVRQIGLATDGLRAEVLFVDDSHDDTPTAIELAAVGASLPVRMIHRTEPVGGLSGAVQEGLAASSAEWCIVMDGDLQHPPSLIPLLLASARNGDADVVVASRYLSEGSAGGLANVVRRAVSSVSTTLTRAMFPVRLAECTDPMTGFFAIRREAVHLDQLRPRGFKILLEILARHQLKVAEIPFVFGERFAGESKASLAQGVRFLTQLAALRFGRMSRFAIVGGFGALLNIAIVAGLTAVGTGYVVAAIIAAEVTILTNFLMLERLVFADLRNEGRGVWRRLVHSFTFNNVETVLRLPVLTFLVSNAGIAAVPATAVTLLVAFLARFTFHSRVVYRPRSTRKRPELEPLTEPQVEELQ